ncbi:hypothetical protein [uncultured Nostoc sp.]|uniref:hypothetical protein n=1 Tax=uncultured Nostoc sp. TaxID=340711 RepID=UPI002613E9D3|nr:hypothetical protein [uncultured Nostoc sp.]
MRSGFSSQLYLYILNKTWFFSCDRIPKQAIYVPGCSTSQNRVAPVSESVDKQVTDITSSNKPVFKDEIVNFALDYATQVEYDYTSFVNAYNSGVTLY